MNAGSYLGELPPVQVVPRIKLKYENVINLSAHPYTTVYTKEKEKEES